MFQELSHSLIPWLGIKWISLKWNNCWQMGQYSGKFAMITNPVISSELKDDSICVWWCIKEDNWLCYHRNSLASFQLMWWDLKRHHRQMDSWFNFTSNMQHYFSGAHYKYYLSDSTVPLVLPFTYFISPYDTEGRYLLHWIYASSQHSHQMHPPFISL